jgi:hypothetical protein
MMPSFIVIHPLWVCLVLFSRFGACIWLYRLPLARPGACREVEFGWQHLQSQAVGSR